MKNKQIHKLGKKLSVLILSAASAMGMAACGSYNSYDTGNTYEAPAESAVSSSKYIEDSYGDYELADTAGMAMEEDADFALEEGGSGSGGFSPVEMEQKIVVTWSLDLETENYDEAVEAIRSETTSLGGYIESESESAYSDNDRYNSFTLRIPSDKVEDMIATIDESGTIVSRSQNSENITLQYVDTESRLDALRTEQEALENLMAEAETVEDLIAIQSELTNVNYEIESYESQIRAMDNDVDYSAVYVYVNEVKAETEIDGSVGTRIKENFRDSVYGIGNFFQNLFVFVIGYILNIVIWIAVIALIVFAIKKLAKRRRERREQMPEKKPRRKLLRKRDRKSENIEKSEE